MTFSLCLPLCNRLKPFWIGHVCQSILPNPETLYLKLVGKLLNENVLSIMINNNKYAIPPISEKSVTFLGRTISNSLPDKHQVDNLSLSVNKGLAPINKSKHRPVQKAVDFAASTFASIALGSFNISDPDDRCCEIRAKNLIL